MAINQGATPMGWNRSLDNIWSSCEESVEPSYIHRCPNCGNQWKSIEELSDTENLLCLRCVKVLWGDKHKTRQEAYKRQGHRCIVNGCPWKEGLSKDKCYHLHRILLGRLGGRYEPDNCVLVCPYHHRRIEGLSRSAIETFKCLPEHLANMNTESCVFVPLLSDYDEITVKAAIKEMCKGLGVSSKSQLYDVERAVLRELE